MSSSALSRDFARSIALALGKTPKEFDVPTPQRFYHFTNGTWTSCTPTTSTTSTTPSTTTTPPKLRLTTWNIDFAAPAPKERMAGALSHLSDLHTHDSGKDLPSVIFLQEMTDSDLEQIQQASWVRDRFFVTDLTGSKWSGSYGTTTLVDKRLEVRRVFRVLYSASNMQRDGLFVDVGISRGRALRLCNTHLESLTSTPPRRPLQLKLASEYMHGSGPSLPTTITTTTDPLSTPHASILAGDLNAFAPEDRTSPAQCNLQDAFLVLGGQEDTDEGYTWGQQVPAHERERYGCSRMDKVLFCGELEVDSLARIGEGVEAWVEYPENSDDESEDSETRENVWVTDHLGLQAVFKLF